MKSRVVYLMSGNPHMPYLVCSLWTLRKNWDGEIIVCAWPDSYEVASHIAEDDRLQISDVCRREPKCKERNGSCVNHSLDKIKMIQDMRGQTDVVLYLDADTTIHGNPEPLMDVCSKYGFAATRFNQWVTTGNKAGGRVKKFRDLAGVDQEAVEKLLEEPWPSINSGIFAAKPESPVLDVYYDFTLAGRKVFIADEIALNVTQPIFVPQGNMVVVSDKGKWNCSPKFQSEELDDSDVVIYHYHGDSNVQPVKKSQKGFDLWWPIYQECLRENVGNMREWKKDVRNKHIDHLEEAMSKQEFIWS